MKKSIRKFSIIVVAVIVICTIITKIVAPSQKYSRAMSLIESGDYEQAYILLNGLNYKDSSEKLQEIIPQVKKFLLLNSQVGSSVYFGSYEQDNKYNGKENIEWQVLAKENNKVLLISKYVLDCHAYNTYSKDVTWQSCSLRTWLNGEFANTAFSSDGMKSINVSTVVADKNPEYNTYPGNNTNDKVFLLSIKEANQYFNSDESRKCTATQYAVAQIQNISFLNVGDLYWWLRSPRRYQNRATFVNTSGVVVEGGNVVEFNFGGVRPAIWIDLSKIN